MTQLGTKFPRQTLVAPIFDVGCWTVALLGATYLRYHVVAVVPVVRGELVAAFFIAAFAQLSLGATFVYRYRWRISSFEEVLSVTLAFLGTGAVLLAASYLGLRRGVSLGDVVAATLFASIFAFAGRATYRLSTERLTHAGKSAEVARALIFGAGDAGSQLLDALLALDNSPYEVVAMLDDSPRKQNLRMRSISVVGDRHAIAKVAERFNAKVLLIAIANVDASTVRELSALAADCDLDVKIVPSYTELAFGALRAEDLREVTVEDLMGRQQVDTDLSGIQNFIEGKRVLVTGAGGSIGSELCRQLAQQNPADLVMLDRDESGLHATLLNIKGRALFEDRSTVVCDIRDEVGLDRVFNEHRPDIVFHAAALKHLSLLEQWPREALQTNVWGTLNVLKVSAKYDVSVFVNISTDKAADPISVLGYTKRIAERLTASFQSGKFLSVRFGNVLGSRGSFLPAFQEQIAQGGPITITHPEVERYFMTVSEAVQLTLQAATLGRAQQVMVLDMGSPVKIIDVANQLISDSNKEISIVFTGLRPGEKLKEKLFGSEEIDIETVHQSIFCAPVDPLSELECEELRDYSSDEALVSRMFKYASIDSIRMDML